MERKDPFRLRVLKALSESLKTINPQNGSRFDLSSAVFVGRDRFGDGDPVPMVCVLEDLEDLPPVPGARDNTSQVNTWRLLVQGFVDSEPGEYPLTPAYHLAAEVECVLAKERTRTFREPGQSGAWPNIFGMEGRVDSLIFSPAIIRPADDEISEKAYFWLRVTLQIVENLVDPYD